MRTLRFHQYGEPADVLRLDDADAPSPGADRIRVRVAACGLNPADWALCRGLFAGALPRGIGLDVAGVVDAVGDGVAGVAVGDAVFGSADFGGYASAGAAEHAVLSHWAPVPPGLDMIHAASLTMAVETAYRSLESLAAGHTLVVHGGGTMMGFAAVQMALMRGAKVIATAGDTYAERLGALGATVTGHGPGMARRVRDLAGGPPDLILATAGGALAELVEIAGGGPRRVLTISDPFEAATAMGVRHSFTEGTTLRYDMLDEFGRLAAEGRFSIPLGRSFPLDAWREALDLSLAGRAHGKLVLLPGLDRRA